jgi:hypothetical protein
MSAATQVEQQVFVFFSNICCGPALARALHHADIMWYNSLSSDARPKSIPGKNKKYALSLRPPLPLTMDWRDLLRQNADQISF